MALMLVCIVQAAGGAADAVAVGTINEEDPALTPKAQGKCLSDAAETRAQARDIREVRAMQQRGEY